MKSLYPIFCNTPIIESLHRTTINSSSFSKIQNYFQFFVELWKWNQIKSLYPIFRNTPITELHREDRNSSFFIKSLRRSKPRASQKLLSILRRVMKMESNEITIPTFRNTPITESLHREDRNSSSIKSARRSKRAKRSRDFN